MLEEEIKGRRRQRTIAGIILIIGFALAYYLGVLAFTGSLQESKPWSFAIILSAWIIILLPFILLAIKSEYVVGKALYAVPFPQAAYPEIAGLAEDICISTGLRDPVLWYLESEEINAYAVPTKTGGSIFLTRGLVEDLGKEEKRAVLAHEIARIHHEFGFADRLKVAVEAFPDMLTAVLGKYLGSIAYPLSFFAMVALVIVFPPYILYVFTRDFGQLAAYFMMVFFSSMIMIYFIASSARNDPLYNQERYYQADLLAAKWTMFPEALVGAMLAARETVPERAQRYIKRIAFVPAERHDEEGYASKDRRSRKDAAARPRQYKYTFKQPPRALYYPTVKMRIEHLKKVLRMSLG